MKTFIVLSLAIVASLGYASAELTCEHRKPDVPTTWIDIQPTCTNKMREQIKKEIGASMQYLSMAAYFSQDSVNRPGFAKLFFEAAGEEREHAIKLIEYLLMRGELRSDVSRMLDNTLKVETSSWESGLAALKDALKLEATVTKSIRSVITKCESDETFNHYHLVDYLTGVYLEEQYKGQRDLAGKISILDKMSDKHGALGEFLFDKKLLSGEV